MSFSFVQGGSGPKGEKGVQGPPGPPVSHICYLQYRTQDVVQSSLNLIQDMLKETSTS